MRVQKKNKWLNKVNDVLDPKKIYVILLFVILITILYIIWGFTGESNKYKQKNVFETGSTNRISSLIRNNDIYEQEFFVADADCQGVAICFGTFEEKIKNGSVLVSISSGEDKVFSDKYKLSTIEDNKPFHVLTNQIVEGRTYKLTLQFVDMQEDTQLVIYTSDSGRYPDYGTSINSRPTECDVSISALYFSGINLYTLISLLLCVLVMVCSLIIFIHVFKGHYRIERIFLGSAMVLGIVYLTLIPIGEVPDAGVHMNNAYGLSNRLMGITDTYNEKDNTIAELKMRKCDYNTVFQYQNINGDYMLDYFGYFAQKDYDTDIISTDRTFKTYPKRLYFFSAAGMTIGRVFHMNTAMTFLLGEVFNLAFYILCIWYSLKRIPFARELVFVIATLPMSMQQAASFSYDAPVNAVFILLTCEAIYIYTQDHLCIKWKDWAVLLAGSWYMIPVKEHAFLPSVLFLWIFVLSKYLGRLSQRKRRIVVVTVFLISLLGISVLGYLTFSNGLLHLGTDQLSYTDEKGYTLNYFLQNPLDFFRVIYNTVKHLSGFYLRTFIGQQLGALDLALPKFVILPFVVILLLVSIRNKEERSVGSLKQNLFLFMTAMLYLVCTFAAMLFGWSRISTGYIEGVQGRYFIPVIVMLLLIVKNIKFELDTKLTYYMVTVSVLSHVLIIVSLYNCVR